jgi:Nucleoside-diphosphate-sugar epimerases
VVFASTAAVYEPEEGPHEETDEPGPMDIYGRTKLVGEDLVERFHRRTGVPAASARLFNVYGTRETNQHLIRRFSTSSGTARARSNSATSRRRGTSST